MTLDPGWTVQAVTALDLSAMSGAESIVVSGQAEEKPMVRDENLGGLYPPQDITELTTGRIYDSEGPAMPLHVSGGEHNLDEGLMRAAAGTGQGLPVEGLREYVGQNQMDQAFASNLAAFNYTDQQHQGRIVDYTA